MNVVHNATVAIVGAGSAGISIAARLIRKAPHLKDRILIVDPSDKHYYQPLWTLVGGGAAKAEDSVRDQASLIPGGVEWIKDEVAEILPDENRLLTHRSGEIHYDYLIVAAGVKIYWDRVPGLKESIGKNGVCSNYSIDYVQSTWENIRGKSSLIPRACGSHDRFGPKAARTRRVAREG